MRRIALLVAASLLATAAAIVPEPAAHNVPDFFPAVSQDVAAAGVVYCPWAEATLERDTLITIASAESAEARLTFPSPIPGDEPDTAGVVISGAGASRLLTSEAVLRGESPLFLEFTAVPVAAFTMVVEGSAVSAEACAPSVPKVWQLTGATTAAGKGLQVRIFNPFPENAKVTVTAISEFGSEPLTELEGIGIPARSWRSVQLDDRLRFRDEITVTVSADEGRVVVVGAMTTDTSEAVWSGTGLGTEWIFAAVSVAGSTGRLAVANPGLQPVDVAVDVLTPEGPAFDALGFVVDPQGQSVIDLEDLVGGPAGIIVRSSGLVAAAVVAEGAGGLGATVGAPEAAERWLLPGGVPDEDATATVWVVNPGSEDALVTLQPLGAGAADKLTVPGGSARRVAAEPAARGYLITGAVPIVAAWSVQAAGDIALVSGVPVR